MPFPPKLCCKDNSLSNPVKGIFIIADVQKSILPAHYMPTTALYRKYLKINSYYRFLAAVVAFWQQVRDNRISPPVCWPYTGC